MLENLRNILNPAAQMTGFRQVFTMQKGGEELSKDKLNDGKNKGRAEGFIEGETIVLRRVLLMMARIRFGASVPADLPERFARCNLKELQSLQATIETSSDLATWIALLPPIS